MRLKSALLFASAAFAFASCQPKNANQEATDTTTIYGNSTDTGRREGDTVIDRGMGDTAGVQSGGTKTNVGQDTVGKQPHDH
ncbi:hypothetical protein [Desertivirga arenae]|uniref:hypothetical protein n=1 Tax=Desertivirga arenae TaxID=2810309 RepID=UPI001A9784F1|nr:hypothetical protein [Pedobacter sp. SYSU D00823]